MSANETGQQPAAASGGDAPLVDPQLLMAARRGDSEQLKQLLRLDDEEEQVSASVIVEVVPQRPRPAAPPPLPLDGVTTMEGDSLLHVVAACGDSEEFLLCAEMIYYKSGSKRLLAARNSKGDTPLHCAAGAGNAEMIGRLVALAAQEGDDDGETSAKAFLRMQNQCGETALHHAVRAASEDKVCCIHQLMAVDSELACIPRHDGASPLYLAISLGELKIASHLFGLSKGNLSYSGPDGRNALHAAVSSGYFQALPMVLGWLKAQWTRDTRSRCGVAAGDDLLSELTGQGEKKKGSTPLHLAASLDGLPSTRYVPIWSPRRWTPSASATRLLLGANVYTAYQPDKEGLYPIHVAAGAGSTRTVRILLQWCPECAGLRDGKGRTFLHVAVDKGRLDVVTDVCLPCPELMMCKMPKLSWMLNVQDNNGDTALHHAVHAGDLGVFARLIADPRVRLDVPNKEGMRPVDVAWSRMPLKAYFAWDARIHIRTTLLMLGAPYGENNRGDLFDDDRQQSIIHNNTFQGGQDIHNNTFQGGQDKISENLTAAAQVLAIFSVLITTVTFASAFTLPGGYRSAGDGGAAGAPVLAGSYAFDAFLLSDALAFVCSFFATSLLLYAGVPVNVNGLNGRFATMNAAYSLMWTSGKCLVAAFALGLYVVLLPVIGYTIAISMAIAMIMYAFITLTNLSEGADSLIPYPIGRRRKPLPEDFQSGRISVFILQSFWSYILIFGLPAIRQWARER